MNMQQNGDSQNPNNVIPQSVKNNNDLSITIHGGYDDMEDGTGVTHVLTPSGIMDLSTGKLVEFNED